jgi:hypothetical protein
LALSSWLKHKSKSQVATLCRFLGGLGDLGWKWVYIGGGGRFWLRVQAEGRKTPQPHANWDTPCKPFRVLIEGEGVPIDGDRHYTRDSPRSRWVEEKGSATCFLFGSGLPTGIGSS